MPMAREEAKRGEEERKDVEELQRRKKGYGFMTALIGESSTMFKSTTLAFRASQNFKNRALAATKEDINLSWLLGCWTLA